MDSDDEVLTKKIKSIKTKANESSMDAKLVKESDATKKKPRIQIKLRTTNDEGKSKSKANDIKKEKKPLKGRETTRQKIRLEKQMLILRRFPRSVKKMLVKARRKV